MPPASSREELWFVRARADRESSERARAARRDRVSRRAARRRRCWLFALLSLAVLALALHALRRTLLSDESHGSCLGCAASAFYQGLGRCDERRANDAAERAKCIDAEEVLRSTATASTEDLQSLACPGRRTERVCTDGGDVLAPPRSLTRVGGGASPVLVEMGSLCFTMCSNETRVAAAGDGRAREMVTVRHVAYHTRWGGWMDDALALAPMGAILLDVGADDGLLTLIAQRRRPKDFHVVAVEPLLNAASRLASNLALNGLLRSSTGGSRARDLDRAVAMHEARSAPPSGTCVVLRAIAPRSGLERTMRRGTLLNAGALLSGSWSAGSGATGTVRTISLPALMRPMLRLASAPHATSKAGRIHMVKLEVEGLEAAVLGCVQMQRVLRRGEVTWWFIATRGKRNSDAVVDAMERHGVYKVLRRPGSGEETGRGTVVAVLMGSDDHVAVAQ